MKLKRRTRKEYCKIVKRWRKSGMTRRSFCDQEKLNITTFGGWVKKAGGESVIGSPKLVPLQIDDSRTFQFSGFEVEYPNGVRLRLSSIPCMEDLSRIIHLYHKPCFR